jgi:hypothetical protein
MKTTASENSKSGRNFNVVKLVRGCDWVQYEILKGAPVAFVTNSELAAVPVDATLAHESIARLVATGEWTVAKAA